MSVVSDTIQSLVTVGRRKGSAKHARGGKGSGAATANRH